MGRKAQELGLALLAGLMALWVYARTLAPTITWAHASGDGGDLITAVYTQGVPHPTGYPTYLLLGGLWVALMPGDPAWRLNLMSAAAAAVSVAFLVLAVIRLSRRLVGAGGPAELAGLTAGLALAFSPLVWSQAVVTEVYSLNALFFVLLVWLIAGQPQQEQPTGAGDEPKQRKGRRGLLALGWLWGLGLGNHMTLALAFPLIVLAAMRYCNGWGMKEGGRRLDRLRFPSFIVMAGLALGLAVYLLLPLRASAGPVINWSDARTPDRLWWLVSGQLYRGYVFGLPLAYWPQRLSRWAGLVGEQLTWAGLAAAIIGLFGLVRRDRGLALASGLTFMLVSVFALGYNTTDSYILLIPAFGVLALWAGFGWSQTLAELRRRGRLTGGAAAALGLALPLWLLLSGYSAADASHDHAAADFGREVMEAAPAHAILVSYSDLYSFVLWYDRYALGVRPDVTVIDGDLLGYAWYVDALRQREPDLSLRDSTGALGISVSGRPVCRVEGTGTAWRLNCRPAAPGGT